MSCPYVARAIIGMTLPHNVTAPAAGVVADTLSQRAPTTNPFLMKIKKSDDRHVQRIRHKHGRRPYLAVGVSGDSDSLLELEPTRSKDRGLLPNNIDSIQTVGTLKTLYTLPPWQTCSFRHQRVLWEDFSHVAITAQKLLTCISTVVKPILVARRKKPALQGRGK